MQLGLINSAWLGTAVDTARGINSPKKSASTRSIFLPTLEISPQERRLIRKTCAASDLPVVAVVCCALGIADFNKPVRDFHVLRAKRYLDLGYELDARNMLLVLGEYIWQQEVIPPPINGNGRSSTCATWRNMRKASVWNSPSNSSRSPFRSSTTSIAMSRFLDDVDHPAARANVDISHLALVHDSADRISKLAGRIAHVHLSDCDGKKHGDLPPGRGTVQFPPYLKALAAAGFDGAVSIELEYSPEPG